MTTCLMIGSYRAYVLEERAAAKSFFNIERDELAFPAARALEWLNDHTAEVLQTSQFNDFRAFQTPGRRRPLAIEAAPANILPAQDNIAAPESDDDVSMTSDDEPEHPQDEVINTIEDINIIDTVNTVNTTESGEAATIIAATTTTVEAIETVNTVENVTITEDPEVLADVDITDDAPTPAAVQLYTESEIGSPSIHATPDMPVRHGSFSFATLPPRDIVQSIRQQSLGLDSDATEEDPVYIRAPELVAHEERMRAYEEPSPRSYVVVAEPPPTLFNYHPPTTVAGPSVRRTRSMTQNEQEEEERIHNLRSSLSVSDDEQPQHDSASNQPAGSAIQEQDEEDEQAAPGDHDADLAAQEEEHVAANIVHEEEHEQITANAPVEVSEEASEDEESAEEPAPESTSAPDTAAERSRLRAPRNLGRPVRPTTTTTTQHIRINSLARPRPVNPAPVAAHNSQETRRVVRSKPPTQFVRPAPRPQPAAPKSFTAAQRKKEQDERAAERDAAVKRQQQERRDNKIEELRTKKREEQEAQEREARRKSNEFAQKHLEELDHNPVKRAALETRQEREETVVTEKKRLSREKINNRPALQGRLYGSSSIRPTMLELNQPARPASRLEMHTRDADENDDMTPTDVAPPRSVHDQVTRPVAAPQRPLPRQSQQEATLPAYPNSLHRAPLRGSALQRPGSIFQNTTQNASSTINTFPAPPNRGPDMRQYATQRPPMANDLSAPPQAPVQAPRAQPQQNVQPQPQASASRPPPTGNKMRIIQVIRESSPIPSNVSLPEIHTDSSDEDSDRASLPSWATPRHIFESLASQEIYDTDRIFGPIKRVAIDDVFGSMPAEKRKRLNLRTSSANWVRTGDALTAVEVIEDKAGREAIRNAGGWIYDVSDYHNHDIRSFNYNNNNTNHNTNNNNNNNRS